MLDLKEYAENRNKVIKDYNKGKRNNSTYYKGYMFDSSTQKLIINKWYKQREYNYDDIKSYTTTKDYDGIKGIGCLGWYWVLYSSLGFIKAKKTNVGTPCNLCNYEGWYN